MVSTTSYSHQRLEQFLEINCKTYFTHKFQILKINRHKQTTDRFLVLSEKKIYKLDDKKNKVMRGENLSDVVGLTCGAKDDQLVVIHMKNKNDLVACLVSPQPGQDWVGELAAAIASAKQ